MRKRCGTDAQMGGKLRGGRGGGSVVCFKWRDWFLVGLVDFFIVFFY